MSRNDVKQCQPAIPRRQPFEACPGPKELRTFFLKEGVSWDRDPIVQHRRPRAFLCQGRRQVINPTEHSIVIVGHWHLCWSYRRPATMSLDLTKWSRQKKKCPIEKLRLSSGLAQCAGHCPRGAVKVYLYISVKFFFLPTPNSLPIPNIPKVL